MMKLLIISFFFIFINSYSLYGGESENAANIQLSSIKDDLDVLKVINSDDKKEIDKVSIRISKLILKKILLVRTFNPQIEELNGNSLEVLCELGTKNGIALLQNSNVHDLEELAIEYVNKIRHRVAKTLSEHQKIQRGKGCKIGPK